MFRKRKPEPQARQAAKAAVKLTAAEKREISRILETARGDGKVHSAQDTLPFRQMYPDGLCKLDDHTWSKCIEFEDVNYQLAKPDDQTAIFEALCDMYNAHDASIGMQLSLVSRRMNREDFVKRIEIAAQGDHFDHIRELYTQMLRKQLERGNNGLIKTKYLTLTIEARDSKTARARFSRIVMDALNHFKVMGALAKELDGKEWLEMLHGILHPDGERFAFEWSWLAPSGLSVQDFIAPSSFRFGEARKFTMADKFCAVSFLQISAPEMDDRMLTELLDTDSGLLVSLHIRSMDQNEAIKTVKRKITDIDSMKIDAQKKAVREGFDMDIIPTDLATYAGEAKNILRDLQSRNERMFLMTFLVVNFADSKQKLENDLLRAASVAQKYNCSLVRLDFQQEDGFVSALPLGANRIKIQRGLTTSAVAVFVPFTTQEIFHGGEALYYGLNATSGNMILADRKKLKTPNGMILGTPGSGKSFSAKRSIVGVFLNTKDDILICDPEGEFGALVKALGREKATVAHLVAGGKDRLNAMYMVDGYGENNPIVEKSQFIMSLVEQIDKAGVGPQQKSIIDRCTALVYQDAERTGKPATLCDLRNKLLEQPEEKAKEIALSLELFTTGSLDIFGHESTVDLDKRIVVFDIHGLGEQLKPTGLLVITDTILNRVTLNWKKGKRTHIFIDEFHVVFENEQSGIFFNSAWRQFRKRNGYPTAITQNVEYLLDSVQASTMLSNSEFVVMLNQAFSDRAKLSKLLNISDEQMSYVTNADAGCGLIKYGSALVPFINRFPKDTELYRIMTTKPQELKKEDE